MRIFGNIKNSTCGGCSCSSCGCGGGGCSSCGCGGGRS